MFLQKLKYILKHKKHKILIGIYIIFFLYSSLMIWEIFIGPYRSYSGIRRYNVYPFKTILDFMIRSSEYNSKTIFINLIANIITFIPLGFFISILFRKCKNYISIPLLLCIFIIICAEIGQYVLNVGVMDIDDVILNTAGCYLGLMAYKGIEKLIKRFLFNII